MDSGLPPLGDWALRAPGLGFAPCWSPGKLLPPLPLFKGSMQSTLTVLKVCLAQTLRQGDIPGSSFTYLRLSWLYFLLPHPYPAEHPRFIKCTQSSHLSPLPVSELFLYTEVCDQVVQCSVRASQVAQWERTRLPTQETWEMYIWSLGQKDPQGEGMATHSTILAWRIPWMEEPGRYRSCGSKASDMTKMT